MSYFRQGLGATDDPAAACKAAGGNWILKPFGQSSCDMTIPNACKSSGGQWLATKAGFTCYKAVGAPAATGPKPLVVGPIVGEETIVVSGKAPARKFPWKTWLPILALGAAGFVYFATKKPSGVPA